MWKLPSARRGLAALASAWLAASPPGTARAADWYTGAEEVAGDALIVAVDGSVTVSSQGSSFAKATGTAAVAGTLAESGARVRVEGLGGTYGYRASTGGVVHGEQAEGSALAGYEWVWRDAALAGYVGLNLRDDILSRPDPGRDAGLAPGLKTIAEFYARPTEATMVHAYGSYSTAHNAYYARMRGGFALPWGGYVGPEAAVLGDDFYNQWRVGAHLSAIQFGPVQVGVAVGYLRDRVQKGGVYTSLDVRAGF